MTASYDLGYDRIILTYTGGVMGRGAILAAISAAIGALLLGCGGSDDLSKAEFVAQANTICKKGRNEASKKAQGGPGEDITLAVAALLNKEANEIGALEGPSDDDAQIEAIVSGARKAADEMEAKGDYGKAEAPLEEAEKLADGYGLDECLLN
jgi:hypothetical protein